MSTKLHRSYNHNMLQNNQNERDSDRFRYARIASHLTSLLTSTTGEAAMMDSTWLTLTPSNCSTGEGRGAKE